MPTNNFYLHHLHNHWFSFILEFSEVHMEKDVLRKSFSRQDIRLVIKFEMLLDKRPPEIHGLLLHALGDQCPSIQTVRHWFREFAEGKQDVADDQRAGRPVSASTNENVEKASKFLEEDRRVSCEQVAEHLGVSVGTAHHILTVELGKKKIAAKWVPHILTEDQLLTRVQLCRLHLRRYWREKDDFLNRIVAGDETWCYSYDPELKQQSSEWTSADSPRPTKARREKGPIKVMHVIFFDRSGILLNHCIPPGQTVNGDVYMEILQKLRRAIHDKRPELHAKSPILLHDNAGPHRRKDVVDMLESWGWEILPHPPYSPDLSPCDFHLFWRMKSSLRGRRFYSVEEINDAVKESLTAMTKSSLCDGIDSLVHRWQKCVSSDGLYVE
jgi:histone-lysine N-methyltransferase SETMAR